MKEERYRELQTGAEDNLTKEEFEEGYRFCNDCDGLLININDGACGLHCEWIEECKYQGVINQGLHVAQSSLHFNVNCKL